VWGIVIRVVVVWKLVVGVAGEGPLEVNYK
jgi:hypothetical protein